MAGILSILFVIVVVNEVGDVALGLPSLGDLVNEGILFGDYRAAFTRLALGALAALTARGRFRLAQGADGEGDLLLLIVDGSEIGRASCRERV